jgi:hypothetical protein
MEMSIQIHAHVVLHSKKETLVITEEKAGCGQQRVWTALLVVRKHYFVLTS